MKNFGLFFVQAYGWTKPAQYLKTMVLLYLSSYITFFSDLCSKKLIHSISIYLLFLCFLEHMPWLLRVEGETIICPTFYCHWGKPSTPNRPFPSVPCALDSRYWIQYVVHTCFAMQRRGKSLFIPPPLIKDGEPAWIFY